MPGHPGHRPAHDRLRQGRGVAPVLAGLADLPSNDPRFQDVTDLFWQAHLLDVSGQLATLVWESLKGQRLTSTARAHLLVLLYNCQQREALRTLAQAARDVDDHILHCLRLLERSEAEAVLRPQLHQAVAAFRGGRGKKNTEPWLSFFERVGGDRLPDESVPCDISPTSDTLRVDGDQLRLDLRIEVESFVDPPQQLWLELGSDDRTERFPLPIPEGDAGASQSVSLALTGRLVGEADGPVFLPYRIGGRTRRDKPIDRRGQWELGHPRDVVEPLSPLEIEREWPGQARSGP